MKKILLFLFFFQFSITAQDSTYIIGVDVANSLVPPHSVYEISEEYSNDAFWNQLAFFGVNFAALNYKETSVGIPFIKQQLAKAKRRGIDVFLWNQMLFPAHGKRWLWQMEGSPDTARALYELGQPARGISMHSAYAQQHWKTVNNGFGEVPTKLRLNAVEDAAGVVYDALLEEFYSPKPGDELTASLRVKKWELTNHSLPLLTISLSFDGETEPFFTHTVMNKDVNGFDWTDIELGSFTVPGYTGEGKPFIRLNVTWHARVSCDLDYFSLDDPAAGKLFAGELDSILVAFADTYMSTPGLGNLKVWDEPRRESFLVVGYMNRVIQQRLDEAGITDVTPLCFHGGGSLEVWGTSQQFLVQTGMKTHLADTYVLRSSDPKPEDPDYTVRVQKRFRDFYLHYIKEQTEASRRFGIPLIAGVQAHSYSFDEGKTYPLREPSAYEIRTMANMALAHGAAGVHYFLYASPEYGEGFLKPDGKPRIYDEYGYQKWDATRRNNIFLRKIGPVMARLHYDTTYTIETELQQLLENTPWISNLQAMTRKDSLDTPAQTYVELGLFSRPQEPETHYLFLVNKRTHRYDARKVKITIAKTDSRYENWSALEATKVARQIAGQDGFFEFTFDPGEAKLVKIEPALFTGGRLAVDEIIDAGEEIKVYETITVTPGQTLTLKPGSKITFTRDAQLLVMDGGKLVIEGTPDDPVILDFTAPASTGGNGVYLNSNSHAKINNTIIRNARYGVFVNRNAPQVSNTAIENCEHGLIIQNTKGLPSQPLFENIRFKGVTNEISSENAEPVMLQQGD